MDYTTLTPEGIEAQTLTPAQTQSLYEVCRQIVDGRAARGKQYELAGLLIVLVLAKRSRACRACWEQVNGRGISKNGCVSN